MSDELFLFSLTGIAFNFFTIIIGCRIQAIQANNTKLNYKQCKLYMYVNYYIGLQRICCCLQLFFINTILSQEEMQTNSSTLC